MATSIETTMVGGTPEGDVQTPEQAEAQLAEQAAETAAAANPPPEVEAPAEPELPEGFKDWGAVAASLMETKAALTKAQQGKATEEVEEPAEGTPEAAASVEKLYEAIGPYIEKFNGGQDLTPEDFANITKATGFPQQFVEQQLRGAIAYQKERASEVYQVAGGSERSYAEMVEWAKTYLPKQTLEEFDAALESDHLPRIKFAVQGMYAAFQQNGGGAPSLMIGDSAATALEEPFASVDEMAAAMNDPKYQAGDPATVRKIERRVAASPHLYT